MAPKSTAMTSSQHTRLLLRYAVASRLLVLILIILWRSIVSPYDTSASINPPCLSSFSSNSSISYPNAPIILLPGLGSAIENSIVWDSVYFVRIAECGYEYEQSYAFLPLLPLCISLISRTIFAPLVPIIGHRAVLGLSGYVLNNIAFVFAAFYLYGLSLAVLKDTEVALRASVLFCFNPASIFYSSIYSESLYALLSIGGLYHFMNGADNCAIFLLALSGSARSNGVLSVGYICYRSMQQAYDALFLRKPIRALLVVLAGALRSLCIIVPFISFQAYGYLNLCMGLSPNEMRPWCKARLPFLYSYIQSHYWGVGFLRYFQVKQLPNFLLASPILSLALCSIIYYVKQWPEVFLSLGFRAASLDKKESSSFPSFPVKDAGPGTSGLSEKGTSNMLKDDSTLRQRKQAIDGEKSVALQSKSEAVDRLKCVPVVILPFILHLNFMVVTAFFVMHVQVATRFLSASPSLFWFASHIVGSSGSGKRWGHFIWVYCAAYISLGSLLFSNFYPFT